MTTWKFYLTPDDAKQAMYQACEEAKISIDFEQYIFEDGVWGRKFLELFMKKVESGVRVRLLCDALGSLSLYRSPILAEVKRRGVEVQFFNQIWPWIYRMFTRFLRTHRKILVVDGKTGLIGGVGVRDYAVERRDTHVRITGPVVTSLAAVFERMWQMTKLGRHIFTFSKPIINNDSFTLLTNSPHRKQRFTYWTLVKMFRTAKKFIYITTPYFVPDWRIFRALKGAARRGVDVQLMVPNSPDWRMVRFANSSFYARALRSGMRIFEYGPDFIHAKTCVIDDAWAYIGSTNIDSLSLLLNYEADIASTDKKFVAELKSHFAGDLIHAKEVYRKVWRRRSFVYKILEFLVLPLHKLM